MYYEDNQDLSHDFQTLTVDLLGLSMRFKTDRGVFSKNGIDYGSRVLLENYQPEGEKTLLDVGCGYGTLGLTLAKKFDLSVTMVDVNSRALDLCRQMQLIMLSVILKLNFQISMKLSVKNMMQLSQILPLGLGKKSFMKF